VSPPSEAEQIRFLTNLQRILDEGLFTATYKFALLHALADLCVRVGDDSGGPLVLATEESSGEFVRLYWHQARPFSDAGVLRQNTGRQAAVISRIEEERRRSPSLLTRDAHRIRHARSGLVRNVERTVRVMPLTKLQTIGERKLDFLYTVSPDRREITLRPGVAFCFRRFHGIVRDLVRGAWLSWVRRHNTAALGSATELSEFLFPGSRAALAAFGRILREVQEGECLYCRRGVRGEPEIDHFVPWSRYPVDLGENLVFAHRGCNQRKSHHLAAEEHLEAWTRRNRERGRELEERFREADLAGDRDTVRHVAVWAYEQVDRADGQLWVEGRELRPISDRWREILCA